MDASVACGRTQEGEQLRGLHGAWAPASALAHAHVYVSAHVLIGADGNTEDVPISALTPGDRIIAIPLAAE